MLDVQNHIQLRSTLCMQIIFDFKVYTHYSMFDFDQQNIFNLVDHIQLRSTKLDPIQLRSTKLQITFNQNLKNCKSYSIEI